MYWQKRFDIVDPDKELEVHILSIRKENKDFRYRHVLAFLKKDGILINKRRTEFFKVCPARVIAMIILSWRIFSVY